MAKNVAQSILSKLMNHFFHEKEYTQKVGLLCIFKKLTNVNNFPKGKNLPNLPRRNVPRQNIPRQNMPRQNMPKWNMPKWNMPWQNIPWQNMPK
jgi:hypothetical protein